MIKSVCFDVGNTLVSSGDAGFCTKLSELIGYSVDDIRQPLERYFLTTKKSMEESLGGFCNEFNLPFDQLKEQMKEHSSSRSYRVFDDAVPALKKLSGYKLAVLSNSTLWETADISRLGLASYFDTIVNSFDIGVAKPNIEAYRAVQDMLGLFPENLVMVGDSKVDIYGAKKAGWYAIYLDRKYDAKKRVSVEADSIVRSLLDLPVVIKSLQVSL